MREQRNRCPQILSRILVSHSSSHLHLIFAEKGKVKKRKEKEGVNVVKPTDGGMLVYFLIPNMQTGGKKTKQTNRDP